MWALIRAWGSAWGLIGLGWGGGIYSMRETKIVYLQMKKTNGAN
jgi:hypothetical protein